MAHDGAGLHHHAGHDHGVLDQRALADGAAHADHAVTHGAVDLAALGHEGTHDLGRGINIAGGEGGVPGVDFEALVAPDVELGLLAQQLHVGLPKGVDGAHILPVAVEIIGHQLVAAVQQSGDDVLAEVVGGFGVLLVGDQGLPHHLPGEAVDAHGGVGGLGLLGLLLEFIDGVVGVGVQDAEAGGLLQGHVPHSDGAGRTVLLMIIHHLGVVHLIDVVAGEDDHILRVEPVDEVDVLIDGVGGALVPALLLVVALIGGQHLGAAMGLVQVPGLAVADVFVQLQGLILGQDAHGIDAGVDAVGQGEVNNAVLAAKGHSGLGGFFRQNIESAALATGQKHGNAAFFLKIHGHSSLCKCMMRL